MSTPSISRPVTRPGYGPERTAVPSSTWIPPVADSSSLVTPASPPCVRTTSGSAPASPPSCSAVCRTTARSAISARRCGGMCCSATADTASCTQPIRFRCWPTPTARCIAQQSGPRWATGRRSLHRRGDQGLCWRTRVTARRVRGVHCRRCRRNLRVRRLRADLAGRRQSDHHRALR